MRLVEDFPQIIKNVDKTVVLLIKMPEIEHQ